MNQEKTPVLMVAYHFPPSAESGAARPYRFYKYLPHFGYAPRVITASRPDATLPDVHFVPDDIWPPTHESLKGSFEILLRRTLFNDDGMTWTAAAARAASRILKTEGAPLVYSTFPPIATHAVALWLKKRQRVKWIADFRDPLVGNPFRAKQRGLPPWLDPAAERMIFRHADVVIANTDVVAEGWSRRYPQWRDKFRVIWNGFDPAGSLAPAPIPPRPRRVLSHIGNLYNSRRPDLLLASLARLVARGMLDPQRLLVQLLGPMEDGAVPGDSELVRSLVAQGCLEYRNEMIPRALANRLTCEADLLLLIDLLDPNAGLQVPAKLFDYVRIGRPILAFTLRDSPLDRILTRSGVRHACVYLGDREEQIDRQVLAAFQFPNEPVRASEWFWNEFDGMAQTRTLAGFMDALLETPALKREPAVTHS